ncbi:MAG: hypothetical protein HGB14_12905 [Anaerolineaceae bacterium]|nr:hypothetical protein [Anaerolineaceae bacterium]
METERRSFEEELKYIKGILSDSDGTIPVLFFSSVDMELYRISEILTRRRNRNDVLGKDQHKFNEERPLPWWVSVVVVALASQIPTLLMTVSFDETQRWRDFHLGFLWMGYILLGLSAILIARIGVVYLFRNVNSYVVDKIQRLEDLQDLEKVLKYVWLRERSRKYVMFFTLAFSVLWSISFSNIYADYLGVSFFEFGYGLIVGAIVFGILAAPALFMEAWFFIFILHVGSYKFQLNETAPVYSEVVQRFSRTTTNLLYSFALFIAFSTYAVSFDPASGEFNVRAVLLVAIIGWVPTTIYFMGSQVSINRIITSAKWDALNRIQNEIGKLHNGDIVDKDTVETINRLMEYHTRIRTTPNSTLGFSTGLNFVNQLALPFIGLLLTNLDKVRDFLFP